MRPGTLKGTEYILCESPHSIFLKALHSTSSPQLLAEASISKEREPVRMS